MILYFPVDRFDEVVGHDQWVIGRRLDSYVRGRLPGGTKRNTCDGDNPV
jgi:hypothetical protein